MHTHVHLLLRVQLWIFRVSRTELDGVSTFHSSPPSTRLPTLKGESLFFSSPPKERASQTRFVLRSDGSQL